MVQGTSYVTDPKVCAQNWDNKMARKSGYEAIQKKEQEKKSTVGNKGQGTSGGAWGQFKNKDNFVNMHIC